MGKLIFRLSVVILLITLPFIMLIRGSVFFHEQYEQSPWFSIIAGMTGSVLIVSLYLAYAHHRLKDSIGHFRSIQRRYVFSIALVSAYCFPGLFYFSAANAKHPQVKEEFTSLHPILRLSISTLVWLNGDLIVTDAGRFPDDYRKMRLKAKAHSLHYRQSDGYAHAVDIRTIGHSEFRNRLVESYFELMGFSTLRHVGTADHLHVSLSSHDRPGGI